MLARSSSMGLNNATKTDTLIMENCLIMFSKISILGNLWASLLSRTNMMFMKVK